MSESGFVPGSGGPESIDRWAAEIEAKAARFQEMRAGVEQVSVTHSSSDDVVTVTVDAGGNVTDLKITDRVREMSGTKVASLVLSTMRAAQTRLADEVAEVMRSTVGDDQTTMDTVLSRYHSKFPEEGADESEDSDQDDDFEEPWPNHRTSAPERF